MAGQRQTVKRTPLLDKKGRLQRSSWAAEDLFIYNRENAARLGQKEWEYYQVWDPRFVFRLLYGHSRLTALVRAEFWDTESGRHFVSGPVKWLPGDSFDLEFGPEDPHHLYMEEGNFFLSLDYDGRYRRLRCRGGAFDVELMLPRSDLALATATPFNRRRQFYYGFRRIFPELRGKVTLNEIEYPLGDGTFVCVESGRGVMPRQLGRVCGVGCGEAEGHQVAVLLGWGFGYARAGSENACFVDGELLKLNRVREKRGGESYLEDARFRTEDGRLQLNFRPEQDHFVEKKWLPLQIRSHRTVGKAEGRLMLLDGTPLVIRDLPFLCEHSRFRW